MARQTETMGGVDPNLKLLPGALGYQNYLGYNKTYPGAYNPWTVYPGQYQQNVDYGGIDNSQMEEYQRQLNEYAAQQAGANAEWQAQMDAYNRDVADYQRQLDTYNTQASEQQAAYQQQIEAAQQQQQAGQAGYQRSTYGGLDTFTTPGNVIAPQTYQSLPAIDVGGALKNAFAFAGMQAGQPYGLIPTNPTYQGVTGYQRATSYANPPGMIQPKGQTQPINPAVEIPPLSPEEQARIAAGKPRYKSPDWKQIVPESQPADYEAYEKDAIARGATPRTNVTGWDKSKIPDTLVSDKFPHGQARGIEDLIANGMVDIAKDGTAWFVIGAYAGLPAQRFPDDIAFIQSQVASGKWTKAWADEYARLIGLTGAAKVVATTAPKVAAAPKAAASGYSPSANYGQGGYTPYSYGGYSSPGATTPTTGNMPGWLMPWQKVRI